MRSPAAAIAWELRQRHRWGLTALCVSISVIAAFRIVNVNVQSRVNDATTFALFVVVPMTAAFLYIVAVFSFGLSGDLAARHSIFPSRMFTLPISTTALAGWPMLFGTAALAMLWFVIRMFGVWPSGARVPVIWPAILAASLLAWTQALMWMPYPLRGLRVIVAVLWLAAIDAVVLAALALKASEPVMLALLAPHVPLAYFAARFAISRARSGRTADWGRASAPLERMLALLTRRRDHFRSPLHAQSWFEWRMCGRTLPSLVAMVLPFELALLFIFRETPAIVFEVLLSVLFTPTLMAIFVGATIVRPSNGLTGLAPFISTRPISNASLIAAKLKTAARSTLVAWLLVVITTPLAIAFSGTRSLVMEWIHDTTRITGTSRAIVLALLAFLVLVSSTWKQLVQSLYIGLSGRDWLVKASVFVPLTLLAIAFPLGHWVIENKDARAAVWNASPWILAALALVKLMAAAYVAIQLHDRRLLSDRTLLLGALGWDAAVIALYAVLVWLLPDFLFRSYFLALVAILAVPLARIAAAPLAIEWSRHR